MRKFTPQEAEAIRNTYDALVQQDWFNRNTITERELLKIVLQIYRDGAADNGKMYSRCEDEARKRFLRSKER